MGQPFNTMAELKKLEEAEKRRQDEKQNSANAVADAVTVNSVADLMSDIAIETWEQLLSTASSIKQSVTPEAITVEAVTDAGAEVTGTAAEFVQNLGSGAIKLAEGVGTTALNIVEGVGEATGSIVDSIGD